MSLAVSRRSTRGLSGLSWLVLAASSPDFGTITFLRTLFLQVTSDFPQVLNFVLQSFDLRQRTGEAAMKLWEWGVWGRRDGWGLGAWPLPVSAAAEGPWVPPGEVARLLRTS